MYSLVPGSSATVVGASSGRIVGGSGITFDMEGFAPTLGASLPGDVRDDAQMQAFSPDPSRPWWEAMAVYGITRAIDNRYAPPTVSGNVQSGSFAGQNGRTYGNTPNNAAGQPQPAAQSAGLGNMLVLAAAAVAAFLILG